MLCFWYNTVCFRVIQKVTEAFIQDQPGCGLLTALCDLQDLLPGNGMPGRIIGIAEKDKVRIRRDLLTKLLHIRKKTVFRAKTAVADLTV